MDMNKTEGLIAAPFTPMKKDGSLNLPVIEKYADKLKADGLSGVFVCGTTGEGMLMTLDERMEVAKSWMKHQTADFKVIVHVGTTSFRQSRELAQHAVSIGAYGTGCMGPVFLPPGRVEELVGFCVEVAAGAPDLPFYYYHIPSVSGVRLPMIDFIRQGKKQIPNLAGIKFTDNNFLDMAQCIDADEGKWDILHGFDELLLAGLTYGIRGAVGSTYNFMAPLYLKMMGDFDSGKLSAARERQAYSRKVVGVLNKYGGAIPAGKALMKWAGVDCGPSRFPIQTVSEKMYRNLVKDMEQLSSFMPGNSGA